MPDYTNDNSGIFDVLVGFGRALRQEGVVVGSGQVLTFCTAAARLDPTDLTDLYWGGRACLVTRHVDLPIYDRTFRAYFLDQGGPVHDLMRLKAQVTPEATSMLEILPGDDTGDERPEEEHLGLMASAVETLRHKRFEDCTPEELEAVRRLMARFRLRPPSRRTRRTRPGSSHRYPDLRRTIRQGLRTQGEMIEQCWRDRRIRRRKIVLILDVSGSMTEYSRALLQFAHSAARVSSGPSGRLFGRVEVFCFGTKLTRITEELQKREPDHALAEASRAVVDWEGGTKIGASLDLFVRTWGRRGLCRGAIVVICSDGLERGHPELLETAMERLARLSHRIVWMNPLKGDNEAFRPRTVGMLAALPYIDLLLSGHDLSSLEELAECLPHLA
ncbi:MAG TPA: VWA domain-containing protein [Acidimicrobiia bacterium]|nr:VWA domain-containing protein [Acidimicrobiia bacterium]